MYTIRQLREFDTIEFSYELSESVIEKYKTEPMTELYFFLEEGVQKHPMPFINAISYTYFKLNKQNTSIYISNYVFSTKHKSLIHIVDVQYNLTKMYKSQSLEYKVLKDSVKDDETIYTIVATFISIFAHLTELINNREIIIKKIEPKKETDRSKNKKNKNNANNRKLNTASKRTINLLADNVRYVTITSKENIDDKIVKRKYNRQVESWTVRGHIRRYKSGKVVYIKPHIKGSGKKETKIYRTH